MCVHIYVYIIYIQSYRSFMYYNAFPLDYIELSKGDSKNLFPAL